MFGAILSHDYYNNLKGSAELHKNEGHSSMWQEFHQEKQVIAQSFMEKSHRQVEKQS